MTEKKRANLSPEAKSTSSDYAKPVEPGAKFDDGKLRYDLLPAGALERVVAVLTYGAQKYSPDGWRKVPDAHARYTAAAMRHLEAFRRGEEIDKESDIHHLAHACCNLLFLLEGQW